MDVIRSILRTLIECGSSQVRVTPQKVTEAWAPDEENKWKRNRSTAKSSELVQSRNMNKRASSSSESSIDAKKMKSVQHTKKPSRSNVVLVREANKQYASPSPQASPSHNSKAAVRISSWDSSANSKSSGMSNDSGLEGENANIITEKSDGKSQEIAKLPDNMEVPKLQIEGLQLATSRQQVHRRRRHTRPPVQQPQPPWLLNKNLRIISAFREVEFHESHDVLHHPNSHGGVAFEVQVGSGGLQGDGRLRKRKPAAVRRLERKPRQRNKTTREELEKKQTAAMKRRKEIEQKLVERLQARQEKEREIKESLSKFLSMIAEKTEKKMEVTLENREAHIKAVSDRLKEKSKHVKEVKAAKKCRQLPPLKPLKQPKISHDEIPVVFGM